MVVLLHADARTFHLEVEDSGPGIPEDQRARVFTRGCLFTVHVEVDA